MSGSISWFLSCVRRVWSAIIPDITKISLLPSIVWLFPQIFGYFRITFSGIYYWTKKLKTFSPNSCVLTRKVKINGQIQKWKLKKPMILVVEAVTWWWKVKHRIPEVLECKLSIVFPWNQISKKFVVFWKCFGGKIDFTTFLF